MNPLIDFNLITAPVPHDDGHFISKRISDIVDIIRERYQGRIDVRWIPPERRGPDEPAFAIIECLPDGRCPVVFHVKSEREFDASVLTRLIEADNAHGSVLDKLDAHDETVRLIRQKVIREHMEEQQDIIAHAIKSPLHTYRLAKNKVLKDNVPDLLDAKGNKIRAS